MVPRPVLELLPSRSSSSKFSVPCCRLSLPYLEHIYKIHSNGVLPSSCSLHTRYIIVKKPTEIKKKRPDKLHSVPVVQPNMPAGTLQKAVGYKQYSLKIVSSLTGVDFLFDADTNLVLLS
jgi:hypothetical protein